MNQVEEAVCWSGPAVIILFPLGRSESHLEKHEFELSALRPDAVAHFPIWPEPGGSPGGQRVARSSYETSGRWPARVEA